MIDFFKITPKKRRVKINRKKGIIYNNPSGLKRKFFYIGNVFFIIAFFYFAYLYWPIGKSLYKYKFHPQQAETNLSTFPKEIPVSEFAIQIPKILAISKIISNVSPFNQKEYLQVLKNDEIAQARGSSLPGQGKGATTYLFAHSTQTGLNMVRKNSVFYLLGELEKGDVVFIKYNGKVYTYRTYMKRIVNASEIQYLDYKDENKNVLILQTCWPIGTDWKRLLVFAELV